MRNITTFGINSKYYQDFCVPFNSNLDYGIRNKDKERSIVLAPGHDGTSAFVVESQTLVKPHYVTASKNGKVTCEDCPGWKASKICAHH